MEGVPRKAHRCDARNKCGIEFDACKKEVPMRGTIALALSTDGTDGKWWAWAPMTQIDLE